MAFGSSDSTGGTGGGTPSTTTPGGSLDSITEILSLLKSITMGFKSGM